MTRWRFALALLVSLLLVTAGTLSSAAPLGPTQLETLGPTQKPSADQSLLQKAPPGIEPQRTTERKPADQVDQRVTEPTANRSSPWTSDELVVAIDGGSNRSGRTTHLVADALTYWNTRASEYATYQANFTLKPAAEQPDIIVRFESDIDCTSARWELGCAPIITPGTTVEPPAVIRIDTAYTNATTRRVLKHEFGHILGIRHEEAPRSLMRPRYAATAREPLPNASERANPWGRTTLTVYVAEDRLPPWNTEQYYDQIHHALTYYQEGADGTVPESLTFRFVNRRSEANIVISYWPQGSCDGVMVGSCASSAGIDLDNDDSREYLTQVRIALAGIKQKAVGWHVGYWMGLSLEPTGRSALAPPFQTTDPADRTSAWWTDEQPPEGDRAAEPSDTSETPDASLGGSLTGSRTYNR